MVGGNGIKGGRGARWFPSIYISDAVLNPGPSSTAFRFSYLLVSFKMRGFVLLSISFWLNAILARVLLPPQANIIQGNAKPTITSLLLPSRYTHLPSSSIPWSQPLSTSTLNRRAIERLYNAGTYWTDAASLVIMNVCTHGVIQILGYSDTTDSKYLIGAKWNMNIYEDREKMVKALNIADHLIDTYIRIIVALPEQVALPIGQQIQSRFQQRFPDAPLAEIIPFSTDSHLGPGHQTCWNFELDLDTGGSAAEAVDVVDVVGRAATSSGESNGTVVGLKNDTMSG